MKLYHGSNTAFEEIQLSKCLPHKDFGKGFYLTPVRKRALERALDKCDKTGEGIPFIQTYELDERQLADLNIIRFDNMDKSWLDFILKNRDRKNRQGHEYDVVIGPVADDGVITSISLFEAHVIDEETLMKRLKYPNPYIQYAFCTQKAIDKLIKV